MNENGLNTIGLNVGVILGQFWPKIIALVGLGNGFDGGLRLGLYCGFDRTLVAQGKPRQTQTFIYSLSRH